MSKLDVFRDFITQRLTTATLVIIRAAEKSFAEFEEEISRSKEESARLQRLLDIVSQPEIKLHRTDVQHLSLPEPPQIKEEQELWTSQDEEQLQGLQSETTDSSMIISNSVEHDSDQEGFSECSHLDQTVKVENREGDSLLTNTTDKQIEAESCVQVYAEPEHVGDSQNNVALSKENMHHTLQKMHQCQQCHKTFGGKGALVFHMRGHTGEKPHHCQECNMRFRKKSDLVRHMRTHTGEKPYECQQCNKCFSKKSDLVVHIRTHTGEKPYQCQVCSKVFARSDYLVEHIRTHTGEKPYQCQQCNRSFRRPSVFIEHMRKHTEEKPY